MPTTTGYIKTENGSKYLQQLCKHFEHKIEVSYDANTGRVAFEMGTAHMSADAEGLTVTSEVDSAKSVEMVHHVIDSHLAKFAFREDIKTMTWTTV